MQARNRRVEIPETVLCDAGRYVTANAGDGRVFVNHEEPVSFLDGVVDGLLVQRIDRLQVHDLGLQTVGGQSIGGFKTQGQGAADTYQSQVFAFARYHGLADRHRVGLLRHVTADRSEESVR